MSKEEALREAGLTDREIRVYLALLGLGQARVHEIAKESGLLRPTAYEVLESLARKGLASYAIKSGVRHFEAAGPSRLLQVIEERRKGVEEVLPELEEMVRRRAEKPVVETYEGREGLKTFMSDMIRRKINELHVFGAEGRFRDMFGHFFVSWDRQRVKGRILMKIIYNERLRKKKTGERIPMSRMRFFPGKYVFPSTTFVFGGSVGIVLWAAQPLAVLIKSTEVAKSYENFFELLWDIAKV